MVAAGEVVSTAYDLAGSGGVGNTGTPGMGGQFSNVVRQETRWPRWTGVPGYVHQSGG